VRTDDFSQAPPQAQATAMFIGATRYAGLRTLVELVPMWRRMVREMKRSRGYRWHRIYYEFPLTLGTMAFFADREALLKFGRSRAHRELMCWLVDHGTRNATAGFIRFYSADPDGYSNGIWRAEDGALGHIPTWTPLRTEAPAVAGPPVHRDATPRTVTDPGER
jgi:hypothetical protein